MFGLSDEIRELEANACRKERVSCADCGYSFWSCYAIGNFCPNCKSTNFKSVPWWYGRDIPSSIHGKKLADGRKVVPKFFVEVRANIHPVNGGDPFLSWLEAEKWFKDHGWEIMGDAEWYAHKYYRNSFFEK